MATKATVFDGKKAYQHAKHLTITVGPRLTGSAAEHKAAAYITKTFKSFGLKVTNQRFPSITYDNLKCELEVRQAGKWRKITAEPVLLSKNTPPAGLEGEIFFAEAGQLEYLTPAMKGKIVLVCGTIAVEDRPRLIRFGAKAIVNIDPSLREGFRRTVLYDDERTIYGSLPMVTIRHIEGLDIIKNPADRIRLVLRNTEKKSYSLNVIGEKTGTDFPDEIIVLCAHYDSHWRTQGAIDNAGGTAVMMELARILAGRPSKRTLRFVAFAAEETGLFGSRFYANELLRKDLRERKKPSFNEKVDKTERDQHRLTFNFDMHGCPLGRFHATFNGPEDLGASMRLFANVSGTACDLVKKPMSSDGTPLAAVGIPNVQFARGGGTNCFGHQAGDELPNVAPDAFRDAGQFADEYLSRYVTNAATFPFAREIPEDQMKDIKGYFTTKHMIIPGE